MHFENRATPAQCLEREQHPEWDEKRKEIFMEFCEKYNIKRATSNNCWVGWEQDHYPHHQFAIDEARPVFDHKNVWVDKNGDKVVSACPYCDMSKEMRKYADKIDSMHEEWKQKAAAKPFLKKWYELEQYDGVSMHDHIFFYPEGYHFDGTCLIVIDATGVKLLQALYRLFKTEKRRY